MHIYYHLQAHHYQTCCFCHTPAMNVDRKLLKQKHSRIWIKLSNEQQRFAENYGIIQHGESLDTMQLLIHIQAYRHYCRPKVTSW